LLDCGIGHDFNFQPYLKFKHEIQAVNLILISHSSIEYAGALPLLIEEFGIEPNKIFTSQPVMRYAPLNLHE
jgi:Cft2 family RNA processing exonuclease